MMMRAWKVSAVVFAAGAVVACADTVGPELTDELLEDVALLVADATLEDVGIMTSPFGFGSLGVSPSMGPGNPGAPGGPRGIGGPLSGTRSVTFYDADGVAQDAYDRLTTASVHFVLDVAGEVTRERWSASLERSRDETVTGLLGEETTRTFNGTGTESVARSRHLEDGVSRSYAMNGSFEKTDVVVPVPGPGPRWPLSGTIRRTLSVTVTNGPKGDAARSVDVTITFNGTATAQGVINGWTFEIDLRTLPGRRPLLWGPRGR